MGFDTTSILRRYRGEWLSGNVSDPYMAGETVSDLGSVYYSNIDNNSGNVNPSRDPNWTLSARAAIIGSSLDLLIGSVATPTPYGSLLAGSANVPILISPSIAGDNLTFADSQLSFSPVDQTAALLETVTHFSSEPEILTPSPSRYTTPEFRVAPLIITSNNKICQLLQRSEPRRVFDMSVVPRGEIEGVREAVWGDWNYWYVVDTNNDLYAQSKISGELIMITDNVRNIQTVPSSPDSRTVICKMDGTVWGWGDNSNSHLVPNEVADTGFLMTPIQITGLTDIQRVFAFVGGRTFFASNSANELFSWGENSVGMAGRTPTSDDSAVAPEMIVENFDEFYSWRRGGGDQRDQPVVQVEGVIAVTTLILPAAPATQEIGGITTWGAESLAIPHAFLGQGETRATDNWVPTEIATDGSGCYRSINFSENTSISSTLTVFALTGNGVMYSWGLDNPIRLLRGSSSTTLVQLEYDVCDFTIPIIGGRFPGIGGGGPAPVNTGIRILLTEGGSSPGLIYDTYSVAIGITSLASYISTFGLFEGVSNLSSKFERIIDSSGRVRTLSGGYLLLN